MTVTILRLGHRVFRDQRMSTHVFLVARAMGVVNGFYSGERDTGLEQSTKRIATEFGGTFTVEHVKNPIRFIKDWKGEIVHLTVYGLPVEQVAKTVSTKDLLVVVGGEKVQPEVYQLATKNIAVTSQPHSEVGALSLFLYLTLGKRSLQTSFSNAKRKIIPQERGKKIDHDKGARV
ncbi:MAG: tRNA (cytidine(56)-2'-O)-methyltransferase [Nanoarchaeota archaeon]|nr:tRNA (cytidine(56)-2'-O)-methyltransferase [Nanoarchaeota archaeon]